MANFKHISIDGTTYDAKPAGSYVTGVKGSAESTYRTGNVNLSKTNVGLGNVPNVTTNNQTPTFSQASTRDNLVSGEKLSVLFGKIMKWFADLKTVAFTGSYTDLSNLPTLVTGVKGNSESTYRTGNVNITKANIGLGSVGNFKAVSTSASQGLSTAEQLNARNNIGVETLNRVYTNTDFDNLLFGTNNADRPLQFCVWGVTLTRLPSNVGYLSGYIYPTVTAGYRIIIGVDFANSNMYFGIAQKDASNNISIVWRKVTAT